MKIAVIGSGAAGIAAAWGLSGEHQVTVYEKAAQIGGHVATVTTPCEHQHVFDNGFLVFNFQTYPIFSALLKKLNIGCTRARMNITINGTNMFTICEDIGQVLRSNHLKLLYPSALWLIACIFKFNRKAKRDLANNNIGFGSIDQYLKRNNFGDRFFNNYLGAVASAIWVCPPQAIREIPADSFIKFFDHHHLLSFKKFRWYNVEGGADRYIKALANQPNINIKKDCAVQRVSRHANGVHIEDAKGDKKIYDQLVFACHADTTQKIFNNPTRLEKEQLSAFSFLKTRSFCHTDKSLMPTDPRLWSAWNCSYQDNAQTGDLELTVSYFLNGIYRADRTNPVFLTVDPLSEPDPDLVLKSYKWSHFKPNARAIAAQKQIAALNGKDRIWYVGAWRGYGFHEDAIGSGLDVARQLGCAHDDLPEWNAPDW